MLFIGIDLGTSAVKLVLMDDNGGIRNIVSKEYPLFFPNPGWAEQNPTDWYEQTIEGLKELIEDVDRDEITGISFGGQMHGLVTLSGDDTVIRPAILWNDGRTVKQTEYLNNVIGKENLSSYTANIAFAGFTAPKILWMQEEEENLWKQVRKIMLPKDYLIYRLTGIFATDYSDASGMLLLDVKNRCWSKEMLSICNVSEDMLPALFESYEVVGTLLPEIASKLGLSSEVKVIAGASDNAAAAIGTGTVGGNSCTISIGTSGTVFVSNKEFCVDNNNALHSFAHGDGGFHLMGCMLSAASCNKWWMEEILHIKDYNKEQERISKLGKNHVFFAPYLMGERSPHNDPNVRGAFIGLGMESSREDMTQAVLEGVAFGLRDSIEIARTLGVRIDSAKLCGGGAKSKLWREIIAAVLNLPLEIVESEEGPGYGGAILAAVGCGKFDSVKESTDKLVKVIERIEPKPELVQAYEERYQEFKRIYSCIKEL